MSSSPHSDGKRSSTPHDETISNSSGGSGSSPAIGGFARTSGLHATSAVAQTVEEFSSNLTASGLISADELRSFYEGLNGRNAALDVAAFASLLIEANKLTPYQAENVRQGHTRGLVLGNYVILDKLGEGGMGMVFKARHRLMKRIVALKVLPPSMTLSSDAVQRFHREVEVAARLTHPNIASAHDADQADGIHFLVMEYVEGPSLSALVRQVGPLAPPLAMNIIAQAARGLAHAHRHGVVHRDIKPGNLMVSREGMVKVLDMGLAQLQSHEQNDPTQAELTQSGRIMGTVDYMAPEQALDAKNVDHRADIYSLGCTLFYLLAGKAMSPEGTLTQKLLWHQSDSVPPLRTIGPDIPEELETLFHQMVAKEPAARPADMNQVVEQLERLLEHVPPEQLELPAIGVELNSGTGSSTDHGPQRGRMTMVDRPTRTDHSLDSQFSLTMLPHSHPLRRAGVWLLSASLLLGAAGIAAGFALFMYLAPPAKSSKNLPQSNGKSTGPLAELIISSEPNARIYVNNKEMGRTDGAAPHQLELSLPPGRHRIRVVKDGFDPFETEEALTAGKPLTLLAPLVPSPGVVEIMTDVEGMRVSVNDRLVGTPAGGGPFRMPLTLPPGGYTLRFEAPGYESKEEPLQVRSGDKSEHGVKLAERPYRRLLNLVFEKSGKEVDAPAVLIDASAGRHQVRSWADVPPGVYEVIEIDLSRARVKDLELAVLQKAESLVSLSLAQTEVGDEGAKLLEKFRSLEELNLERTAITDKALRYIADLPKLRELDLRRTRVTDLGLESLALSTSLERLHLSETNVGDAGVKKLVTVKTLKSLSVDSTQVTEDAYEALGMVFETNPIIKSELNPELGLARKLLHRGAEITIVSAASTEEEAPKTITDPEDLPPTAFHITGLSARGSLEIDNTFMNQLAQLSRLQSLDLDGSGVTDDGLARLHGIRTLRKVQLGHLRVAKASVASLKQALGDLDAEVEWLGPRDRMAAEWVLQQGGHVRISASPSRFARQLADLPENRDFQLEEIYLVNRPKLLEASFGLLKDLRDLRVLNLVGSGVTEGALAQMTGCPNVKALAVSGPQITGEALTALVERFPNLQRLHLIDTAVAGQSLLQLGKLSQLESLSLAGTTISDVDVSHLASLSQLAWLSLDGVPLTDDAVTHLVKLQGLKTLSFDDKRLSSDQEMMAELALPETPRRTGLQMTDAGLEQLADGLKQTKIHHRELDPQRLAARWILEQEGTVVAIVDKEEKKIDNGRNLPRSACEVVEVTLRHSSTPQPALLAARLKPCTKLRRLDLSNLKVTDQHVASLGALDSLESLGLAKTHISDAGLERLGRLENLRILDISDTFVSGSGLAKQPWKNLTQLYASHTNLDDQALAQLAQYSELRVLKLDSAKRITDRGVSQLRELTRLEELDLSSTNITDASGPALASLKSLKRLKLNQLPGVSDALVLQLRNFDHLEQIGLAHTKITDASLAHLATFPKLQSVYVRGTAVTNAGAAPLNQRIHVDKSDDPAPRDPNTAGRGGF